MATAAESIQISGGGFGLSADEYQCRFSLPPSGEPSLTVGVTYIQRDRVHCAPVYWIFGSTVPANLTLLHNGVPVQKQGQPATFVFLGKSPVPQYLTRQIRRAGIAASLQTLAGMG